MQKMTIKELKDLIYENHYKRTGFSKETVIIK